MYIFIYLTVIFLLADELKVMYMYVRVIYFYIYSGTLL